MDRQHKDLFQLAERLSQSVNKSELVNHILRMYTHVKEHFHAEEDLMNRLDYDRVEAHVKEHHAMLAKLLDIDHKIQSDAWRRSDMHVFIDQWSKHIIHSDMAFNTFLKQRGLAHEQV